MGTNFYLVKTCDHCGQSTRTHVGKSSSGWVFALRVAPDEEINSLDDWKRLFALPLHHIENEYGEKVTTERLLEIITNRHGMPGRVHERQWLSENTAEPGPNNLARSRVDGRHCVGHGEGTWSYHGGEFS